MSEKTYRWLGDDQTFATRDEAKRRLFDIMTGKVQTKYEAFCNDCEIPWLDRPSLCTCGKAGPKPSSTAPEPPQGS